MGAWRVGRKVGRTVYLRLGDEPSDDDTLIGVMDTPELARQVVDAAARAWPTAPAAVCPIHGPPCTFDPHTPIPGGL